MAALCVQACTCVCVFVQLYSSCDLTLFWKSGCGSGKHAGLGGTCSAGEAWVSPWAARKRGCERGRLSWEWGLLGGGRKVDGVLARIVTGRGSALSSSLGRVSWELAPASLWTPRLRSVLQQGTFFTEENVNSLLHDAFMYHPEEEGPRVPVGNQ